MRKLFEFRAIPGRSVGGGFTYTRVRLAPDEEVVDTIAASRVNRGSLYESTGYITLTDRRLIFTPQRGNGEIPFGPKPAIVDYHIISECAADSLDDRFAGGRLALVVYTVNRLHYMFYTGIDAAEAIEKIYAAMGRRLKPQIDADEAS